MISKSPQDYQYYEDRLKFLRDEQGKLMAAEQEGEQRGLAKGIERGIEKGIAKGIEKGMEKGKLAGRIQTLQELLGDKISSDASLMAADPSALTVQIVEPQQRLNDPR